MNWEQVVIFVLLAALWYGLVKTTLSQSDSSVGMQVFMTAFYSGVIVALVGILHSGGFW